jgi:hypothetical protein
MIESKAGAVKIHGTKNVILAEFACVIRAMIDDEIVKPLELFSIVGMALESEGIKVIKGDEKDLEMMVDDMVNEIISKKMSDIAKSDNSKKDDFDDDDFTDDVFKFLRGEK